ncbi:hypothetical protein [Actinophytocola sp.]|uniref:hypothetical protein n=1 Tax=Actinophytocola sp. TaxID=1872138 RepID=UPI002D66C040|nr:hypothetical protein [Actinophytocola sp.]HYQ62441.1 hypothetical protein [Actinophytocola sp.]
MSIFSKPDRRWLEEAGRDFDLREFDGSVATGRVAIIRLLDERTELAGKHVLLTAGLRHVTVIDQAAANRVVIRIPWGSFVDAGVHAEPGTPRLRLDLAVQLGITIVRFALWFDAAERVRLDQLVTHIRRHMEPPPAAPPTAAPEPPPEDTTAEVVPSLEVPLLEVRCAPPINDWLVFLPGDCSAEVLRRVAPPPPVNGAVE